MNLLNSQTPKHNSSKHNKKRLTQDQVRLLETTFNYNMKLEPELKLRLARELGIPARQIAIWYQNKRARWRAQSVELEYSAMKLRLEATLADKRRLEREVERLKGELEKAQEMVFGLNQKLPTLPPPPPPPPPPHPHFSSLSRSSCCEERESSGLHDDDVGSSNWVNIGDENLRLEELYACLIGVDGSQSHFG